MACNWIKRFGAVVLLFCLPTQGTALPFNDDMVDSQIKTGQIMRPKVDAAVPLGSLNEYSQDKEDAITLENPVAATAASRMNGQRLFQANCTPCHGAIAAPGEPYTPGPVGKFVPGPNLGLEMYHASDNPAAGYTDGKIFATIRYGNVLMPALGYKLSASEMWDIVNYVRSVQEK